MEEKKELKEEVKETVEVLKPITVEEFNAQVKKTRFVEAPSGAVFEIGRITERDCIRGGLEPLMKSFYKFIDPNADEKNKITWDTMKDNEKSDILSYGDLVITLGVKNPKVSLKDDEEDKIFIEDLSSEDYAFLLSECQKEMFSGRNMKFFRSKQSCPVA